MVCILFVFLLLLVRLEKEDFIKLINLLLGEKSGAWQQDSDTRSILLRKNDHGEIEYIKLSAETAELEETAEWSYIKCKSFFYFLVLLSYLFSKKSTEPQLCIRHCCRCQRYSSDIEHGSHSFQLLFLKLKYQKYHGEISRSSSYTHGHLSGRNENKSLA